METQPQSSAHTESSSSTAKAGVKKLTDAFQRDAQTGYERDNNYIFGPRFPRTIYTALKLEF